MKRNYTIQSIMSQNYSLGRQLVQKVHVKCFLRVPQAVGLYCSCHAAQSSKGNFQKTYYKTFRTSCRLSASGTSTYFGRRLIIVTLLATHGVDGGRPVCAHLHDVGVHIAPVGRAAALRIPSAVFIKGCKKEQARNCLNFCTADS